jgi:stearoyl-CoA desaturase (delta-9 desaturase)
LNEENAFINSICHMVSYRNFDNTATNEQFIALLTAGEGLHDNHHEYPPSARSSLRRGELDLAWLIRLLETSRLARIKQLPVSPCLRTGSL